MATTSWPRLGLIALGIGLAVAFVPLSTASAAVRTGSSGTEIGQVWNFGGMVCKPVAAGGAAYTSRIDIAGPHVGETTFYQNTGWSTVGGAQQTRWYPFLEKWQPSTQTWKIVWAPGFYTGYNYRPNYQYFDEPWVDVNTLYMDGRFVGGAGYYRLEGTLAWVSDANHNGGALSYRLDTGDYSTGTWNGALGRGAPG